MAVYKCESDNKVLMRNVWIHLEAVWIEIIKLSRLWFSFPWGSAYTVCVVHVETNKHMFSHSLLVESSTWWESLTLTSQHLSRSESMAKSGSLNVLLWIALTSSQHLQQYHPVISLSHTHTITGKTQTLELSCTHRPWRRVLVGTETLTLLRGSWERPRWRDRHFLFQRKWRPCPPLTPRTPNKPGHP